MDDYYVDELMRAALLATPCKTGWRVMHDFLVYSDVAAATAGPIASCSYKTNAEFIALANPRTILALLEENEKLRRLNTAGTRGTNG